MYFSMKGINLTWCCFIVWILCGFNPTDAEPIPADTTCDLYIPNESGNGYSCYIVSTSRTNFQAAQSACRAIGSHMVTITTQSEHTAVKELMETKEVGRVWLGVEEYPLSWQWFDGRETFRQGCFLDDPETPDLDSRRLNVNNSYILCESICKGRGDAYGGIQNGDVCWCGSSFGTYGDTSTCTTPCPTEPSQYCGGVKDNDIFVVDGTYSNWGPGLPNNHLKYQSCGELETGNQFYWNDAKCTELKGAVCQLANSTFCDNPSSFSDTAIGNYTFCYYLTDYRMSWFEARYFCHLHNGDLATVDSVYANELIIEELEARVNNSKIEDLAGYWIGLIRTPWFWETGEQFLFTSWASGNPNGNTQHCAEMTQIGLWQDTVCDGVSSFICEYDTSLPTTTAPPTTTTTPPTTTTAPTTTTLKLAPVRDKARHLPFTIEDEQLAAIVAGGVGMLVIIIIVIAVHCHIQKKKNAKRKEAKKDAKRQQFFFGFEGEKNDGYEKEKVEEERDKIEKDIELTDDKPSADGNIYEEAPTENNHYEEITHIGKEDNNGYEPLRHSNLIDKPDLIPE